MRRGRAPVADVRGVLGLGEGEGDERHGVTLILPSMMTMLSPCRPAIVPFSLPHPP